MVCSQKLSVQYCQQRIVYEMIQRDAKLFNDCIGICVFNIIRCKFKKSEKAKPQLIHLNLISSFYDELRVCIFLCRSYV